MDVVAQERRRRIMVAVWAYAYEMLDDPLVSDLEYDMEALLIDPKIATGNAVMDKFFREEFDAFTGQWVYKHPDKVGLNRIYSQLKNQREAEKELASFL